MVAESGSGEHARLMFMQGLALGWGPEQRSGNVVRHHATSASITLLRPIWHANSLLVGLGADVCRFHPPRIALENLRGPLQLLPLNGRSLS